MLDELKKDYIKAIIALVEEDKKSVLLYVAFDLAVVSLTLSEKLFQATAARSPFVAGGLCLLLASAALFFNYYRKIHLSTFEIVDQLLTLDAKQARRIPYATWKKHQRPYQVAYVLQLAGLALLMASYLAPA